MACAPNDLDSEEWFVGETEDGRFIRVMISWVQVRQQIERATRNKSGRSVNGPVTVTLSER